MYLNTIYLMSRIKLQARNQKVFAVHISDKEFCSKLRTPAERDMRERESIRKKVKKTRTGIK